MTPELTIVPVAYNSQDQIGSTVRHLEEVTEGLPVEILVVDNASSDDSAERAQSAIRRGRVIRLSENLGFGRGANAGIKEAAAPRVLVMNDDVLPRAGSIERMMEVLDSDPAIGLVGPRMLHPDGSPAPATRRHLPGLRDELARVGDLVRRSNRRSGYPGEEEPVDVGLLICACVMARSDTMRQLGGFNDAFFIYGEDIDLCARLHHHGLRTVTVPDAVAVHDQTISPERRFADRQFVKRVLGARDIYYRTWLPRPERMLIHLWRTMGLTDQPFRLRYHFPKIFWDGPNLVTLRQPEALAALTAID